MGDFETACTHCIFSNQRDATQVFDSKRIHYNPKSNPNQHYVYSTQFQKYYNKLFV